MARPRTEDGFVMVALDLFAAIEAAGLSGYARIALAEILMNCYGPNKRDEVYLQGIELGAITGLERSNARRAINELIAANVIEARGLALVFNKDYESWTPTRGRLTDRVGGGIAAWIKGSVGRLGRRRSHRRTSINPESTQTPKPQPTESTQTPNRATLESTQTPNRATLESTQTQGDAGDTKERTRVRVFGISSSETGWNQRREEESTQLQIAAARVGCPSDSPPPFPDPDRSPLMAMPGAYKLTDADAVGLWGYIWDCWHDERLCNQFYEHQHWHKAQSWLAAIRLCYRDRKSFDSIRYIEKIASRYDREGVPVESPIVSDCGPGVPPRNQVLGKTVKISTPEQMAALSALLDT